MHTDGYDQCQVAEAAVYSRDSLDSLKVNRKEIDQNQE